MSELGESVKRINASARAAAHHAKPTMADAVIAFQALGDAMGRCGVWLAARRATQGGKGR